MHFTIHIRNFPSKLQFHYALIIVFSFLFIYSENCAPSLQHFPMQILASVISIQISGCGVREAKIVDKAGGWDVRLSFRSTQAFEMHEKSNLK